MFSVPRPSWEDCAECVSLLLGFIIEVLLEVMH